jgi:putative ABC transport system ATP-binding protein
MDLRIRDLTVEFPSGSYTVRPLDGFELDAPSGALVVLLGPSGCGKTTLLSCLSGILTPTKGSIMVGDDDVTSLRGRSLTRYRRHGVGIVFQAFNLVPSLTAEENITLPLRAAHVGRSRAKARATELIKEVGLTDRAHHVPSSLSGGQQQRVAIARALVHDPPLIVADEPTAHLDYIQVESVLRLLRQLARPGRVVVVSTHDERLLPLADKVVEMAPKFLGSDEPTVERRLAAGEVIFEQGDPSDRIYVVEEGEIEIYRTHTDGTIDLTITHGPGSYFGEIGPIFGLARSAGARATQPTRLTGHTPQQFRETMGADGFSRAVAGLD